MTSMSSFLAASLRDIGRFLTTTRMRMSALPPSCSPRRGPTGPTSISWARFCSSRSLETCVAHDLSSAIPWTKTTPEPSRSTISSSAEWSISENTTLVALCESGDSDLEGDKAFRSLTLGAPNLEGNPRPLLRLLGLVRPPRDCLPLPMLEVPLLFPESLVALSSSSLLKSEDDLALARGADNLLLPLDDPVDESESLLRRTLDVPSFCSSSLPSHDIPHRSPRLPSTAPSPSSVIFTKGDIIAALSEGIADRLPTREGILDGPGSLEWRLPARTPLVGAGRELPPPLPAPAPAPPGLLVPAAVPVDLRLLDCLLPAEEEVELADDLLPTLPSSLRLALRNCRDGMLLCLDGSGLWPWLLPSAVRPLAALVAVAGRALASLFASLAAAAATLHAVAVPGRLGLPSPSDSVSTSSARSTAGAGAGVLRGGVCVPAVLVGDPAAIVPRVALFLVPLFAVVLPPWLLVLVLVLVLVVSVVAAESLAMDRPVLVLDTAPLLLPPLPPLPGRRRLGEESWFSTDDAGEAAALLLGVPAGVLVLLALPAAPPVAGLLPLPPVVLVLPVASSALGSTLLPFDFLLALEPVPRGDNAPSRTAAAARADRRVVAVAVAVRPALPVPLPAEGAAEDEALTLSSTDVADAVALRRGGGGGGGGAAALLASFVSLPEPASAPSSPPSLDSSPSARVPLLPLALLLLPLSSSLSPSSCCACCCCCCCCACLSLWTRKKSLRRSAGSSTPSAS